MNKKTRAPVFYQQGDVILEAAQSIPSGAVPVKRTARGIVLAEGEHTGHAHVAVLDDPALAVVDIELVERGGVTYLRTKGSATVRHEEHKPITVPAGDYVVRRVQEYDHFAEEARDVQD